MVKRITFCKDGKGNLRDTDPKEGREHFMHDQTASVHYPLDSRTPNSSSKMTRMVGVCPLKGSATVTSWIPNLTRPGREEVAEKRGGRGKAHS